MGARWLSVSELNDVWRNVVDVHYRQSVFCDRRTGHWYHCDESYNDLRGPYESREEAERACEEYSDSL